MCCKAFGHDMTYGDHVGSDVADAASPALRRVVKDVVDADTLVLSSQGLEVFPEEDILRGDVGKDQVDLGLVASLATADNGADNLQHGGDTSASSDHTKVTNHVGSVDEGTLGAADSDALADHERGHVLGDVALGVGLDQEVEEAGLVVARDGSVRADDFLGRAIGLGEGSTDGDVLADRETEDGSSRRQLEAVA